MSKRSAATVDWEIRDIINSLNDLPFIKTTMFSCAGYGQAGDSNRHKAETPKKGSPTEHHPNATAYVVINYDNSDEAKDFNNELFHIVHETKLHKTYTKKFRSPVITYYLTSTTKNNKLKQHIWNRVRELINSYS